MTLRLLLKLLLRTRFRRLAKFITKGNCLRTGAKGLTVLSNCVVFMRNLDLALQVPTKPRWHSTFEKALDKLLM